MLAMPILKIICLVRCFLPQRKPDILGKIFEYTNGEHRPFGLLIGARIRNDSCHLGLTSSNDPSWFNFADFLLGWPYQSTFHSCGENWSSNRAYRYIWNRSHKPSPDRWVIVGRTRDKIWNQMRKIERETARSKKHLLKPQLPMKTTNTSRADLRVMGGF